MADPPSTPSQVETTTLSPQPTQPENPTPQPDPPRQLQSQTPPQFSDPTPTIQNPNPNPVAPIPSFPPPPLSSSFRLIPSFSPSPLPNYQSTPLPVAGLPPPGVAAPSPQVPPVVQFLPPVPGQPPNPALRPPFAPLPNGYTPLPPQGTVPLPGIARYPSPYPAMVRPLFPMRPPGAPVVLQVGSRPLMPGVGGVRPIIPPILRPVIPSVTPAEKPLTTVYVGKIAPTVEDDFVQSLLRICGPVKSWKRPQDSSGTHRGFGFCEFESPEGVLRALRLLDKFNLDGQELMLNVDEATKGYLGRYVEKKTENSKKLKETQAAGSDNEGQGVPSEGKHEPPKSSADDSSNESDKSKMVNHDHSNFGIVTDEDKEGDQVAMEAITSIVEERLKTKPLPLLPPPPTIDSSGNQPADLEAKLRNGDTTDSDANEHDDETTSDNKAASEQDRLDPNSPDKNRRSDRRSRDRERDLKWEQEREIERYERETERERVRKEREQRRKMEEAEREYEERLRDWEYREREKEKQRQYEREREKEKERKRRKEILLDEDEDDDSRKRWRRSAIEERRTKRLREKEEDLADRLKEDEDSAEAKRRDEREKQQKQQRDATKLSAGHIINGGEKTVVEEASCAESKDNADEHNYEPGSGSEDYYKGDVGYTVPSVAESETRQIINPPTKRLGFGLAGSGKRAAVPSVFNEEDDDEAHKDKKMRPLVPIDYSTEELQAIQPSVSGTQPPNLAAAAEYAKRISIVVPKEERPDSEREKNRRTHDRSSQRERDHNDDVNRRRDESKEKVLERDRDRENGAGKVKTPDKLKLLDAKQLIDMIPKTKDELFLYEINWAVYDKHQLHERMRPWISKKITEFLGEEEKTLVDYIVSSTREHVQASKMLEMLQAILDEEAEMFVLKMWRMLIFEIKKVETGLALR